MLDQNFSFLFQRKLAELESLLLHGLSKASNGNNTAAPQESIDETTSSQPISTNQEKLADENGRRFLDESSQ